MNSVDMFGHVGYVFIIAGMLYLSAKQKASWVFRFIGELIWVILGFYMEMTSIWFWGLIFLAIDLNGYRQWRKDDNA